ISGVSESAPTRHGHATGRGCPTFAVGAVNLAAGLRDNPETDGQDMNIHPRNYSASRPKMTTGCISLTGAGGLPSATLASRGPFWSGVISVWLITSLNLVDCMTGRSAGFSPLRTRPA